ncbi:MAG TPA: hypothetical protein VJ385_23205, partial [Fibrobacteria bacterium]|nr:hypothetical protein [Fibrobacteria bacterium]
EYIVSLLCLDKASDACRMRVIDSAAFRDEAAEEFLRAYREEQLGPLRVHPEAGLGWTSYVRQPTSPDIPAETGIALSVQRVTVMRPDRPCVLNGSFRLPARALSPASAPASGRDSRAQAPAAIVSIGLLLTGSVNASPVVLNLNVPSHAPLEQVGEETFATGYFTLDLCAHAPLAGVAQTYFLYAFSGEVTAGPALAAFVNPILTWTTREGFARQAETAVH